MQGEIKKLDNYPVTLAEAVYFEGTTETVADKISDVAALKKIYPNLGEYKGVYTGMLPSRSDLVVGDWYINGVKKPFVLDGYIFVEGYLILYDGKYFKSVETIRHKSESIKDEYYDVCIVGGGAGGIGAAYALKDSNLKVCIVEKLDALGGTHTNGGVWSLIASPVGNWYKDVCKKLFDDGWLGIGEAGKYKYKSDEVDFATLWSGSMRYKTGGSNYSIGFVPEIMSEQYHLDLHDKIDIFYNTEFVRSYIEDSGCVHSIDVKNLIDGTVSKISAHYFIDCSADGVLCRYGKLLGTDYYVGSDPQSRFNESAIDSSWEGDIYDINSPDLSYRIAGAGNGLNRHDDQDVDNWKKYSDVSGNRSHIIQNKLYQLISPSSYMNLSKKDLIENGNDATYREAIPRSKDHYTKSAYSGYVSASLAGFCKMLSIRESYRIKCDRMLTQADCEATLTRSKIASEHTVAISTWYTDIHAGGKAPINTVNSTYFNGVPYEAIIPTAYKNVLIGSRCLGCSHLAQSSFRLAKLMMSAGYACGKAIAQARESWIDDVRNIDITQLQADVGIYDIYDSIV